jgi:hypothetical protein
MYFLEPGGGAVIEWERAAQSASGAAGGTVSFSRSMSAAE